MPRLCRAEFSEETIRKLRTDYLSNPSGLFTEPCGRCGKRVVAKSKAGLWVPDNHDAPSVYRSGKGSGRKR